ncbi:hypothetical protein DJICPGNB_18025 [Escherichia coli]|nr:hypothetical protein DJICPGNB_18025 [Escherichia coli]
MPAGGGFPLYPVSQDFAASQAGITTSMAEHHYLSPPPDC